MLVKFSTMWKTHLWKTKQAIDIHAITGLPDLSS
jgi:hypothetical protein